MLFFLDGEKLKPAEKESEDYDGWTLYVYFFCKSFVCIVLRLYVKIFI